MEYKIEVSMTPDENYYYFWCILGRNENINWCNYGHGWARTPKEAWQNAYLYYDDITSI